jgi:hypothetical protein
VNVSLSIPSAVAAVLLIIPHKRMWEPNNRHSMQNHGTNVLASKRFSEIMGCMLTSDSSSNSFHAFMIPKLLRVRHVVCVGTISIKMPIRYFLFSNIVNLLLFCVHYGFRTKKNHSESFTELCLITKK